MDHVKLKKRKGINVGSLMLLMVAIMHSIVHDGYILIV